MRGQLVIGVLLLTTAFASAGSLVPLQDDAGSGGDAGDTPGTATELPDEGTYEGMLFPIGDADWFVLSTPLDRAICYQSIVGGQTSANVTLSLTEGLQPAVQRPILPGLELDLGLAAPTTSQVFLGLEPGPGGSAVSEMALSFGTYRFELQMLTFDDLGSGDGGTGGDAGDEASGAVQVPAPCFSGDLGSEGDDRDVFSFEAEEDEHVALSLAQASTAPTRLSLISPSNETKAQIENGGFADVTLDETGQWLVVADLAEDEESSLTEFDYMVGLTINGPEPPPCRPTCATE